MLFGKKKRRIEHVLIVEDEPLVAFDTEHFLRESGFEIAGTVDRVADALALIDTAEEIDLVLLDVNLADGSGIDVAKAAHARGIQILFVTGNCPGDARALAAGCLSKPYPQRDLLGAIDAIEAVVEGKKPKRLPGSFSLFAQAA
ncbi:response regulator [Sphingomonas sp. G-3-2-10]|uniref:response regulator n=1 Tax=Sphingomonas sp. G-3-2-10 TaxID=2728838 RepID=UPI00146B697B|nr:response regulator [Sphingomonas sp. G-3-2-10]NML05299.1 response regulator [Sphingomonas sp. G-3-2-10]